MTKKDVIMVLAIIVIIGLAILAIQRTNTPNTPLPELTHTYCTPQSREGEFCTAMYKPVCGWFDPEQIQCIRYPCANTYSNSCFACLDKTVESWTEGVCPS